MYSEGIILLLDFSEFFNSVTQEDLYSNTSRLNSVVYFPAKDVFIFYLSLIIALKGKRYRFSPLTFDELGS